MKFCEYLKRFRVEKLQLNQKDIAKLLSTDQAKISRLENGNFSLHNIITLYLENGLADYIREVEENEKNIASAESPEHGHSKI